METDAKTLFYTLLKKEITHTGYSTPKNLQIDGSFFVSHRTHTIIILHLWRSLCIRDAGRRDNKITACTADVHDILQLFIPRFKWDLFEINKCSTKDYTKHCMGSVLYQDRRGSQSVGFNRQIFNKFLGTPRNRQVRKVFLRQVPMAGGGREVKGVLELSRNLLWEKYRKRNNLTSYLNFVHFD